MIATALVTGWRRRTGTTGAGEPALADVAIRHAMPAELLDPSEHRRHAASSEGVRLDRLLRVRLSALVACGPLDPRPGDRIVLSVPSAIEPGGYQDEEHEVQSVRSLDSGAVRELALGRRMDAEALS